RRLSEGEQPQGRLLADRRSARPHAGQAWEELEPIHPDWKRVCPGRSAARSDALQTRDRHGHGVCGGPGSAVHYDAHAGKLTHTAPTVCVRVALHRIRDTAERSRSVAAVAGADLHG